MKINKIKINSYGKLKNKEINLESNLNIIYGKNESGKSTLLHLLGGVDNPTSGTVFIKDINIHQLTEDKLAEFRRKEIGIIYQLCEKK